MLDLRDRVQTALGTAYRIERELGGGGMSRVFLAEETGLGRHVVVKVLPPELAAGINAERFHREIQLAASLQHPHIVPLLAAGGVGDVFYYTMPFIEGESLRTRLAREKKLPVRDAVRALREVAGALAYAHARGVVHRDIKPDNVLISDHHALVTDFGVAKALSRSGGDAALTSLGAVLGTPAYMAPEQAAGDPKVDSRADIYALGAMGYEMLAGRPPFVDLAPHRMLAAHVIDPVTPVAQHRPDIPPALAELVMRCLDKEPARRPQTAAEVRDALEVGADTVSGPAQPTGARRRPGAMFVGLGLALVAGAAWVAFQSRPAAALDADRIAIAPFDVLDPGLALWHEGLVDVLSRSLDGAGPLRTVSPTVVVRRWSGRADAVSARALGRETGAGTVVFGGLVGAGADSVRLSATVLDVATGATLAEIDLRDRSPRMDRVADSLAVRVLRELGRTRPIGLVRGTPLGSTSLPALKAFLQGEQFLRRSQWDSAVVYDQHAIGLDSGFALAWSHAGLAAGWAHSASDTLSLTYKIRAGNLNRGLAPRESLIVQAESLAAAVYRGPDQLGGRIFPYAHRMLATLTEAVRRYPADPELWYMLGDAAFHAGPYAGFERRQSLDAFDRSIGLDSAFTPSYVHAIQLALELRGPEAAHRYAVGYLRAGAAGNYATSTALILRLLDREQARSDATVRLIDTMPMQGQHLAFFAIAGWPDSAETGIWFARRHRDRMLREGADSDLANGGLVQELIYRGHIHEAYRSAGRASDALFVQLALLGVVPPDTAEAVFRSWAGGRTSHTARLWWALPWWADRHDTAAIAKVERWIEAGLRHPPAIPAPMHREMLGYAARSSRAYFALAGRDSVMALRLFEALPDSACFGACDVDRLVRIKLLVAQGRYRDAAQRLAATPGVAWPGVATSPTRVLWELERGRVHEQIGNRDTARAGYAFVAAAWAGADSTLQPYVAEARAGLGRLAGETKP